MLYDYFIIQIIPKLNITFYVRLKIIVMIFYTLYIGLCR